jgi:protease I
MADLKGKKVAILATDGFEQSELEVPLEELEKSAARVEIVSLQTGRIRGRKHGDWGDNFTVDRAVTEASADDYDALILPGGAMNPDKLRRDEHVRKFVRAFNEQGKPIAAICHGPWTLIDAGVAKGRRLTSYHSIQADLKNAGAVWVDEEVVVDGNLITSRKPPDLPAFIREIMKALAKSPVVAP